MSPPSCPIMSHDIVSEHDGHTLASTSSRRTRVSHNKVSEHERHIICVPIIMSYEKVLRESGRNSNSRIGLLFSLVAQSSRCPSLLEKKGDDLWGHKIPE